MITFSFFREAPVHVLSSSIVNKARALASSLSIYDNAIATWTAPKKSRAALCAALVLGAASTGHAQAKPQSPAAADAKAQGPKENIQASAELKLLTLKRPSLFHNLKNPPVTAQANPLENLMRPPLMALGADDTWHCPLCAEPPRLSHGKKKLRHHKLTITLTLKPTLYWNDGKQVSALDVKHSIEHYNAKALAKTGEHRIKAYSIKTFPKKPRTVSLTFHYQNQNHLPSLAVPLLPAHLKEKYRERKPVLGTKGFAYGPYTQLTAKGNLYWLRPNPYLKAPPNPSFQKIHIAAVEGLSAARTELAKRDYDAVLDFYPSLTELDQLAGMPAQELLSITGHRQAVIILNLRNPVFAGLERRQALRQQIKEAGLPGSLMSGKWGLAADSFTFPASDSSAFWQEGWLASQPVPKEATAYWQGKPLQLAIANQPGPIAIAAKVKATLAEAGINLTIKRYNPRHFAQHILRKGRFDTLALMMREGLPRRTYFENFHSRFTPKYPSYEGNNFGSWYNKKVNQWLEAQLYDEERFDELQTKIERAYFADVPEIPLFFWPKVMVTRGNLSHVPLARNGFSPLIFIEAWRKHEPGAEVSAKSGG